MARICHGRNGVRRYIGSSGGMSSMQLPNGSATQRHVYPSERCRADVGSWHELSYGVRQRTAALPL